MIKKAKIRKQKNPKNNKKKAKKKEINSYISNKDKLFIPKPERVHQGIDIYRNLIEKEKNDKRYCKQ